MGLTVSSVGKRSIDTGLEIHRRSPEERVVAIAGNPNVGKSTLFNALTGMRQHTGNWPGKTVSNAQGRCSTARHDYVLVDIPGTYSLMAHSAEEEVARNFLCFGKPDAVVIVCDATCLERNLNLVLQTLEVTGRAMVCVNLVDEAERKGIFIDFEELSARLGVPVVPTIARKKRTLKVLLAKLDELVDAPERQTLRIEYPKTVEDAVALLEPAVEKQTRGQLNARWLSLKLLDSDESLLCELRRYLGVDLMKVEEIGGILARCRNQLEEAWKDGVVSCLVKRAEEICSGIVERKDNGYSRRDQKLDRLLTRRRTGYPVMLLLLAGIFWLTIVGANVPSQLLADGLFRFQNVLTALFRQMNAPDWLHGALVLGMYRTLAWVVSVMLPPMAIFFPLFTLLEDSGYLPRIAYNLDRPFKRCCACGKQALTMCMGFGCNAAGVVGCRIIDSPRERLIAILTNSFVPCNGRFPMLASLIAIFFSLSMGGAAGSLVSALMLTALILLGVGFTMGMSKLLSMTVLRGVPSAFTLELPPYRRPQAGRIIVRSILDRTLFVLGRAAAVAAPAGLILWLMANVEIGGRMLLDVCATALDPFAWWMGMDGVLLLSFILGFPANEIVLPIAVMAYTAQGTLTDPGSAMQMKALFAECGWTPVTALCTILFALIHWPCSTTLMTIRKETGSWKWTALAFLLPTAAGMLLCAVTAGLARAMGF